MIRSQEAGQLSSAPEFGQDGTWPPVTTEWLPLRWELFEAESTEFLTLVASHIWTMNVVPGHDPRLEEDALRSDFLYETIFNDCWVNYINNRGDVIIRAYGVERLLPSDRKARIRALRGVRYDSELRRLVHAVRWQRQDPVIQLPPGATHEVTHSVTTGLSVEHSLALAKSVGLDVGGKIAGHQTKLNSQLRQEFGFKLAITAREEQTKKLTLTNQSSDQYKLFAMWHVDHRITVDALSVDIIGRPGRPKPTWNPRSSVEFATTSEPFVTFLSISRS